MTSVEEKYLPSQEIEDESKKAAILRLEERYQEALQLLYRLLDKYPGNPLILISIGNVYFSEGRDYNEAERCFLEAYEKVPELTIIISNLSRLYAKIGRYEEAAEYARRVITLDSKSPHAWNTLGLYYARQGKSSIALDYFIASYSYDDTYYTGAYNAACALTQLQRFEEALQYLEISFADENGYIAALNDDSLAPLRELENYKRIIAEAAERFKK